MISPSLDFTSELFDPHKALYSKKVYLPYPKAKTYNNISEYYSHTFLKKKLETLNSSKNTEKPRERNYEWYYDTLGLSEYQRSLSRCTKKKKYRKGKKPVRVTTIPGSPLKSKKVTVCQSNFKDYCRRKYSSLNITSANIDTKPEELYTSPLNSVSEPSTMTTMNKYEPNECPTVTSNSVSKLSVSSPAINPDPIHFTSLQSEASEFSPSSTASEHPSISHNSIISEPPHLFTASQTLKPALLPTPHVLKNEFADSSDDDSFTDDVLILKMKSNLQKAPNRTNCFQTPVSFHIKNEQLELIPKNKLEHNEMRYKYDNQPKTNDKKLSHMAKLGPSSIIHPSNPDSNIKFTTAVNESVDTPTSQSDSSSSVVTNQNNRNVKPRLDINKESKLQKNHKTSNHKTKEGHIKNKEENSIVNSVLPQKCTFYKENTSIDDSKSNTRTAKKRKISALKSQENVLKNTKLSCATEADSKSKIPASKVKAENPPVINHCTCKFPCGLSHLCTCGYFASAKEVLRKFKIPRKKK